MDHGAELLEAPLVEAELRHVELQRVFVENAEDRLFAEDRRKRRDAEVDLAGVIPELDAAVLRHPAFGDIEVGHDLQPRENRRFQPLRRRQHLVEHAVHPKADPEDLLVGLEVDVGGALLDGVDQHHVDQFHDRRFVGRLLQLEDVDLGAFLAVLHDLDVAEVGLHVRQDAGDGLGLGLVVAVDRLPDGRLRRHQRQDLEIRHEGDVVQGEDVRRIRHGERQRVPHLPDRDHLVLPRDGRRHELQHVGLDVELGQRDRRHAVLPREESDQLVFVDEVEPDEDRADLLRGALLLRERLLELLRGKQAIGDEKISEASVDGLPELYWLGHCNLLLYPTQALQRIGKGLVGVVLVEHENDPFQAGGPRLQVRDYGVEHGVRRYRRRDVADASPERGEGEGRDAVLGGECQDRSVRRPDLLALGLDVRTHDMRVSDVDGGEVAAGGQHGLADLHGSLPYRLFLDDDPALPLDRAGDTRTHDERRVRRIDDG